MEKKADKKNTEFQFIVIRRDDPPEAWSHEIKIVFMLKGNGWLHLERADKTYAISQEDIFVVNSFQMNSILLEPGALAIALLISPSFLAAFSPEINHPEISCKSFLYREERQQPFDVLRHDFALAFRAWYKQESRLSIHLRSRVSILLDNLLVSFLKNESGRRNESGRERLRGAVDYIHKHYQENITLADLATHTYLSVTYVSRSFQKYLSISFTGYLTQVRLLHAASLLRSDKTITDIAYESGFSSSSALIDAFKQYNGITPGQYRRNLEAAEEGLKRQELPTEDGFSTAFVSLMQYGDSPSQSLPSPAVSVCEITADIKNIGQSLRHNWKTLINAGYARDILNSSLQKQITRLQKTVGFRFIRCKGVLDDDMMLFTKDIKGGLSVNYVYLDEVIDFILSVKAKPMLEFGHMPSAMARIPRQAFKRPVFISPPGDMELWQRLISGLMEHLVQRYGIEEMKQWLFEPWISMDLHGLGFFTLEEYADIYTSSYRAIKNICNDFTICGPGCTAASSQLLKFFLKLCRENLCMPQILTLRAFASINPEEEKSGLKLLESNEAFHLAVSGDENYLSNCLKKIHALLKEEGVTYLPIMLDEWSNNIWQRDLCNDTCYKSAYLFKNLMESQNNYYGMGYFNISDQLDEIAPASETFHGGFGLFTRNGIPKSAYRAMQLFQKEGDNLIAEGEGYFITSSDNEVQIFLHNYCHYDMLYRYRNTTHLTKTQRYKVFMEKPPKSFHIQLEGLCSGKHIVSRYGIAPQGGSSYDAWLAMGAPEPMSRQEEKRLRRLSHPSYHTETLISDGLMRIKASLQPHEVQVIIVSNLRA